MLRPASRRARRRNAPAPGPQSYGPDFYQPAGHEPKAGYQPDDGDGPVAGDEQPDDGLLAGDDGGSGRHGGRRRRGRRRIRRFFRLRTVRVILALIAVFCLWVAFSVGQALAAPGGGSTSAKLAEWARDHYLGPVVTFGEWISYNPPKTGGKPGFSLAAPGGTTPAKDYKHTHGFVPNIPPKLPPRPARRCPARASGACWRRSRATRPSSAPSCGRARCTPPTWRASCRWTSGWSGSSCGRAPRTRARATGRPRRGSRRAPATGLLATFNGGFKLDSAGGGFYLNGASKGALVNGAASVVYYRNGTIKIGSWGRELRMTPDVVGVRQNLKLLVDHGKIPATVNQNVLTSWGATLGGGYYVWRSGLGITKGGRIIFAYGPALDVKELASLLRRAGAVEALQLDINPEWMSYDYYKAGNTPYDPTPHALLPTQQGSIYRYYQVYSRDFTVVYAR